MSPAPRRTRSPAPPGNGRGSSAPGPVGWTPPPWAFPTPVRASRFLAPDPAAGRFNIEVAPDLLGAFALDAGGTGAVRTAWYDLQTQLLGNRRGRLGSGRGGVHAGHYLKGIGRTPAAANWNDRDDLYHASGHLSVGSAVRERAITGFLRARGLGQAIVPCESVLVRRLTPAEIRAVGDLGSSSRPGFAAADASLAALTAKPADFARMANFAFALDHFDASPRALGELFLELDRFLRPPGERNGVDGDPRTIADAMDAAFRRGLAHFRAFARAGLFWMYLESNFTLDGRFLDLETPVYFGVPFVGAAVSEVDGATRTDVLGFEEFGYVRHWRVFLSWLRGRLRFLADPGPLDSADARAFLRALDRELGRRFSARHPVHRDPELIAGAVDNLADALGIGRSDRRRLDALARRMFGWWVHGRGFDPACPDWCPVEEPPAPATPRPRRYQCLPFSPRGVAPDARHFARAVGLLGDETDPARLVRLLAHPTKVGSV